MVNAGVKTRFDRQRGQYKARHDEALKEFAEASPLSGTAILPDGAKATVRGARKGGAALIVLRPEKLDRDFYYRARVQPSTRGRLKLELINLTNGQSMPGQRGGVLVYPDQARSE